MLFKHLRTFVFAAETQSFTQTAGMIGATQAAVSQHIATLEREFGALLFNREGRGVTLSDAGRRLYEYAIRIFETRRRS